MTGGVHEHMRAWDPEEDNIIITLLEQIGPKWSRIVQQLPGRSVSSVRNRWQRIEKGRKLREAGHESKNRCQRCGQPKRGHVCNAKLKARPAAADGNGAGSSGGLHGWEFSMTTTDDEAASPRLSRMDSGGSSTLSVAHAPLLLTHYGSSSPSHKGSASAPDGMQSAGLEEGVPIMARMRSGTRICSELGFSEVGFSERGFEALAYAADIAREQVVALAAGRGKLGENCGFGSSGVSGSSSSGSLASDPPTMVPLLACVERQMSDAPPVPPFGREPSLFVGPSEASPDALAAADAVATLAAAAPIAAAACAARTQGSAVSDALKVDASRQVAVAVEETGAAPIDLDVQISSGTCSSDSSLAE